MTLQSLTGQWTLADDSGEYRCDIALPGDGISALHDAGLIPDPYWGRNEYDLRWIAERDWTVTRQFDLTDTDVDLVLSGLDTVVTVRVNGHVVLEARNSFRDYRVNIHDAAKVGANEVSVQFHSSVKAAQAAQDAHPFFLPWQAENSPIPNGNMLRKVQCDFGWDWNIALAPFGIYGDMAVEPAQAARIDRVHVAQDHTADDACVTVTAHIANYNGPVVMDIDGQEITGDAVHGRCTLRARISQPDLWWSAGQGDQPLYDLTVTAGTAIATRRIGLRQMELVTEKDDVGLGFKFRVNGRDVFAKGANWIPADALFGRIDQNKTRNLLQSAKDANMNMIRVWGGGRYEATWFYDMCDELGLMVWQDFMFACNLYPSDAAFLEEVAAEVRDNVARMQHHACLALWCGDNELIGALTWFEQSRKDRDRYLVNYDRLNRCIETVLRDTDPDANWWPSSPSPGPLNFNDAWHDDSSGDMHFWSVWHEGRDFDHYRDVAPRFCSEFGFQSYPSISAIRSFADQKDWNIAAPVLESHQKNAGGNARIAETMFRYFRWPQKFEDFVYLSQVQQGLAIKTAVTHWRSLKPHCMGTLIWQLNDTWPVCSWASLNYGGEWKLLHHMAQHFYADVMVTVLPDADGFALRAMNDTPSATHISVTAFATDMAGNARELGQGTAEVGAKAETLLHIPKSDLDAQDMLTFGWTAENGAKGGDVFAPHPYKHYDLQDPQLGCDITTDNGVWTLSITAQAMAFFVAAEADVPGRFNANALHIGPGHNAEIKFTPANSGAKPTFTLRNLHSATTA